MSRSSLVALLITVAAASGCQSMQEYLTQVEPAAIATAESRGRFELNCPQVAASILSRKTIQPPMTPWGGGQWRAEYTIGVRGCNRQAVYITVCLDAENCNALAETGRVDNVLEGR